jgi:hypothetical protein
MTGCYDHRERALADRIARDHPGWVVLWGVSSRLYWAIPAGAPAPPGTILSAPGPAALVTAMGKAELTATSGTPPRQNGLPPALRKGRPPSPRSGQHDGGGSHIA